jgi:hypothetical protein
MRKDLRFILIILIISLFHPLAQGQPDHFVYAITSVQKNGTEWVALRKLNTQSAELGSILLNGSDKGLNLYDAVTHKKIDHFAADTLLNSNPQMVFGNSVAAIAYDKNTDRLYYTPMSVDQIRYVDLATMKVYCFTDQSFAKAGNLEFVPGTISRMVIAPDGYGYTITNDGNHLFRFSTNGFTNLTDLGELEDAAVNKETIHNPCGNAGGDLVADDEGGLYLISASNKVFKVDINSRQTEFLGTISGLPQNFSTNGAAVNEDGKLLLSSSIYTDSYFLVDPKTWIASSYHITDDIFGTADLANSNVLSTNGASFLKIAPNNFDKIKVYPNPILADEFNVQFNNLKPGNYTIQLADAVGNGVMLHKVSVLQAVQTENIHFSPDNAQGFYFLRILDENNAIVSTQILVVIK